jgi:hypothetical protein
MLLRRSPSASTRLIDATLAFLHKRLCSEAESLADLTPELVAILGRPRCTGATATAAP